MTVICERPLVLPVLRLLIKRLHFIDQRSVRYQGSRRSFNQSARQRRRFFRAVILSHSFCWFFLTLSRLSHTLFFHCYDYEWCWLCASPPYTPRKSPPYRHTVERTCCGTLSSSILTHIHAYTHTQTRRHAEHGSHILCQQSSHSHAYEHTFSRLTSYTL